MVGRIRRISLKDDDTFYTLDVDLSTNFSSLEYVYIVKSGLSAEQDSLQSRVPDLSREN
jgi:rod shape-determining protein MreC